jgi:uncharacterized protein (DUF433 family)
MKRWIVADPEHLGGRPRVRDTRISVSLVLESLAAGMSIAEIVDAYPSLSEESVRGVLAELAHRKTSSPRENSAGREPQQLSRHHTLFIEMFIQYALCVVPLLQRPARRLANMSVTLLNPFSVGCSSLSHQS